MNKVINITLDEKQQTALYGIRNPQYDAYLGTLFYRVYAYPMI